MTEREIDILSQLCQIEITPTERRDLVAAMEQMLEYFAIMAEYTEEGEAEARHSRALDVGADEREAVAMPREYDYTEQAPESESGFFVTPSVLG